MGVRAAAFQPRSLMSSRWRWATSSTATVSFKGHGSRDNPARRTGRFFIVSLVSLGLNSLFVWVLTGLLDGPTWWPLIPMLFVTPAVTFAMQPAMGVRLMAES